MVKSTENTHYFCFGCQWLTVICSRRNTTPFPTLAPNKSTCSAVVGQLAFTVAAEVTEGWVESRVAAEVTEGSVESRVVTEVKGRWVGIRVTAAEVIDG